MCDSRVNVETVNLKKNHKLYSCAEDTLKKNSITVSINDTVLHTVWMGSCGYFNNVQLFQTDVGYKMPLWSTLAFKNMNN